MKTIAMLWTLALPALAGAMAGEREDYLLRAAQRDLALFRELDANHDQALSRSEVQGWWPCRRASTISMPAAMAR